MMNDKSTYGLVVIIAVLLSVASIGLYVQQKELVSEVGILNKELSAQKDLLEKNIKFQTIAEDEIRDELSYIQQSFNSALNRKTLNLDNEVLNLKDMIDNFEENIETIQNKKSQSYGRNVGGEYFHPSQDLMLYGTKHDTADDMMRSANHEIAHWVWFSRLTSSERRKFEKIHDETYPPTSYAGVNVVEDFAESIMVSTDCFFNYSKVDDERKNFIESYVKEYYTFPLILDRVETGFSNFKIVRASD